MDNKAADPLDADVAASGLAVDHGDATGPNREMIEIGLALTGDPSVLQKLERMRRKVLFEADSGAA